MKKSQAQVADSIKSWQTEYNISMLTIIFGILVAAVVFGFIIFIHELGHMLAARWAGIKVTHFSIGFGPALWKRQIGETLYQIGPFPVGGFVKIVGLEQDDEDSKDEPRSYKNAKTWQKFMVVAMGPLFNLISAVAFIYLMGMVGFPINITVIDDVLPGSPAAKAGLRPYDEIVSVNGTAVESSLDFVRIVQSTGVQPVLVTYKRSETPVTVSITPVSGLPNRPKPSIGVSVATSAAQNNRVTNIMPGSEFYRKGLRVDDRIIEIDGLPVHRGGIVLLKLLSIDTDKQESHTMAFQKPDGKVIRTEFTGMTFERFNTEGFELEYDLQQFTFKEWLDRSTQSVSTILGTVLYGYKSLAENPKEGAKSVGGPVAIISMIVQRAKQLVSSDMRFGLYKNLELLLLLSISLGFINLLPIPALDGGRLVFIVLDGIVGSTALVLGWFGLRSADGRYFKWRINESFEQRVHMIGLFALLGLIVIISIRDVLRLLGK